MRAGGVSAMVMLMVVANARDVGVWLDISLCPFELHVGVVWAGVTIIAVFVDDALRPSQITLEFSHRLDGKDRGAMNFCCMVNFFNGDDFVNDFRCNDLSLDYWLNDLMNWTRLSAQHILSV